MKYSKEKFEWTDEFVYRVLARGIFPRSQYNMQETKDAVVDAINGDNLDSVIVTDREHCGEKVIFPVKERLASFPFVRKGDVIVIKSAFYSEKTDIEEYKRNIKRKTKI